MDYETADAVNNMSTHNQEALQWFLLQQLHFLIFFFVSSWNILTESSVSEMLLAFFLKYLLSPMVMAN